jgi:multiple sugar transport system permease protein
MLKTMEHSIEKLPSKLALKRKIEPYIFISPTFSLLIILMLIPVYLVIRYSFLDNVIVNQNPTFVGLKNYKEMIVDEKFHISLKNTAFFTIISVIAHLLIGLAFAKMLNSDLLSKTSRAIYRMIYILPWLFTVAIIAIIWRMMLNPLGVINYFLMSLGVTQNPIEWLSNESTALVAVTFINIWAGYPFYMTSLLAGLQGVPKDLYEAATVDGANGWQRFWSVTFPHLKPLIIGMSILDLIWTSQQFAIIWMTTGGGPINSTEMLGTYTYKLAFAQYEFSKASSAAVFLFLISTTLAVFYNKSQKARN